MLQVLRRAYDMNRGGGGCGGSLDENEKIVNLDAHSL